MSRAAWLARLVRAEGPGGVAARARDRWREHRRRRAFRPGLAGLERAPATWPVLVVSARPPVARLGGVQAQLGARLAATRAPWALLHAEAGGYRLELAAGGECRALERPAPAPPPSAALDDDAFEAAVRWALDATGARALHVEGTADLPLRSLLRLAGPPRALVLAVHDFSLFCVRAHLLETATERFCGWCRDPDRCTRCLRAEHGGLDAAYLAERRAAARDLLEVAAAVIFPSAFSRDRHGELFPPRAGACRRVIAPAVPESVAPPRRARGRAAPPHVAFVGSAKIHKGAAVFTVLVRTMRAAAAPARFSAYGGGDPAILMAWRRLGVRVRGYHRTGTLPARLARDAVDVAVLPSVVPESYSLALSECRRAGVPVVAFDFGAVAERVRGAGDGRLVPCADGAAGLAAAVAAVLREGVAAALPVVEDADAHRAAAAWAALYAELGLAAGSPR